MNIKIIGYDANLGLLRVLDIVKTHLYRLNDLGEEAQRVGELTHIDHEDISWS